MLHYQINRTSGASKTPLVLLHGFLESSTMWDYLDLESDYTVLRIDLPGHGKSELISSDSMWSMAVAVKEVIDHNDLTEYNVIGHSMGGYVAIELSLIDNRCCGVVLLNSNMWADSPEKQKDRKRVAELVKTKKDMFIREAIPNLFDNPKESRDAVEALILEASKMSSEAIGASSIAMSKRKDYSLEVKSDQMSVFVIQGRFDKIAGIDRVQSVMNGKDEQFHVVESGHMSHIVATQAVRDILTQKLT